MNQEWTTQEEARRLRERFSTLAKSKAAFARDNGLPGGASMLSQHLSGHRPLNLAAATAYAKGFGVALCEISPRLAKEVAAANSPQKNTEPGPDTRGMVPLISWVQAGAWCEVFEPATNYHDSSTYLPCPAPHSPSTFALRVKGDSMTAPYGRSYPDGCIIYVDPERRSPKNGDRIVACLDGDDDEVTFKIYKNEDGRQWLLPLNPQHPPLFERFKVIGTVLGKWEDG